MTKYVRQIEQKFIRHTTFPQVELRSSYNSIQPYRPHSHSEISIGAIVAGSTALTSLGITQIINQGELVLIEPQLVHSCNPVDDSPRSYHMLYLDIDGLDSLLTPANFELLTLSRGQPIVINDRQLHKLYISLIENFQDLGDDQFVRQIEALVSAIFERSEFLNDVSSKEQKIVQVIRDTMEQDLSSPLSLEKLSRQFNYRKETIIRLFKREYGLPPNAYLNNLRIEKSKKMIRAGVSLIDIASNVGFVDQSHFHRNFVTHTAATPRQYQLSAR